MLLKTGSWGRNSYRPTGKKHGGESIWIQIRSGRAKENKYVRILQTSLWTTGMEKEGNVGFKGGGVFGSIFHVGGQTMFAHVHEEGPLNLQKRKKGGMELQKTESEAKTRGLGRGKVKERKGGERGAETKTRTSPRARKRFVRQELPEREICKTSKVGKLLSCLRPGKLDGEGRGVQYL